MTRARLLFFKDMLKKSRSTTGFDEDLYHGGEIINFSVDSRTGEVYD